MPPIVEPLGCFCFFSVGVRFLCCGQFDACRVFGSHVKRTSHTHTYIHTYNCVCEQPNKSQQKKPQSWVRGRRGTLWKWWGKGTQDTGRSEVNVDLASPAALIYNLLCSLKPSKRAPSTHHPTKENHPKANHLPPTAYIYYYYFCAFYALFRGALFHANSPQAHNPLSLILIPNLIPLEFLTFYICRRWLAVWRFVVVLAVVVIPCCCCFGFLVVVAIVAVSLHLLVLGPGLGPG